MLRSFTVSHSALHLRANLLKQLFLVPSEPRIAYQRTCGPVLFMCMKVTVSSALWWLLHCTLIVEIKLEENKVCYGTQESKETDSLSKDQREERLFHTAVIITQTGRGHSEM